MVQPTESRKGLNLVFTRSANFCCTTCWRVLRESKMRPVLMVQLDNATPIILNREKSVTFGTLGTLALWLFTKPSSEMGELCFSVASMRSQELGSWRSHNGCSIRQSVAECTWGQYLQSVVKALLDLKALLECALLPDHDVVLQAQHPCLSSRGGADAKVTKPTEDHPTQTISSMPPGSGSAGAASRNQAENGEVFDTTVV